MASGVSSTEVTLKNVQSECTVYHSLFLLEGEVPFDISKNSLDAPFIDNTTNSLVGNEKIPCLDNDEELSESQEVHIIISHSGSCQQWPVVSRKFKAFVKLNSGANNIEVICPAFGSRQTLVINRAKLENQKRFVRVVYIKCSGSDGTFDAPENMKNDVEAAKEKVCFNAKLMQSFTAHDMHKHGFGFQTFQLEEDENGEVVVHVFESKLTTEKAHAMNGSQLYDCFFSELTKSSLYDPNCKFLAFMSCTHYDPPDEIDEKQIAKYVKAHTALGGGRLGLFGTGGLHTWASDVESVHQCFTDATKIDKTKLFDDSAGRGTCWANYSTTLGAAMHELGHCFDLAHTPKGIMGRGFDDMNLFATVTQESKTCCVPPKKKRTELVDGGIEDIACETNDGKNNHGAVGDSSGHTTEKPYGDTDHMSKIDHGAGNSTTHNTTDTANSITESVGGDTNDTVSAGHSTNIPSDGTDLVTVKPASCADHDIEMTSVNTGTVIKEFVDSNQHSTRVKDCDGCGGGGNTEKTTIQPAGLTTGNTEDESRVADTTIPASYNTKKDATGVEVDQDIFSDHGAHWYRSSAVLLHHHKWFNEDSSSSDEEENSACLQVNWSTSVKGPVGNGGGGQINQTYFDDLEWCKTYGLVISGYAVYYGEYIHALEPLTTSQGECKVKVDPVRGKLDRNCSVCFFLMEEGEHLTSVEVRAGAWVDGIRFHTNVKSSVWFGGRGGNWNTLTPSNGERIAGFFGTFGNYLGSLGIHVENRQTGTDVGNAGTLQIEANRGIRLIEVRGKDDIVKFWEFLDETPPANFNLPKQWWRSQPDLGNYSIFVQDNQGNVYESGFLGFKRFLGETKENVLE